ncbi:MAG: glycosyltransferase family 39 protein [bacterium]|nr:glycosyltransferase family 39 protein [bacterium]
MFGIVLLLSIWMRLYHYTDFPQRGATSDEYTYSFLGTSLLTKGIPISWSSFKTYVHKQDLTIQGIYFPIVQPYFDHPPLYALTLGTFLVAFGQGDFSSQQLATIRLMPIILSTITGVLLFSLSKRLYGFSIAIVSLLLYSTVTIFVMNQRVSVAENQLALLFILAMYLFSCWQKKLTQNRIVLLGMIAGAAFLTKIMGASLFASLFFLLLHEKVGRKGVFILSLVFTFFVLASLLYANYYDWQLFWAVQGMQSGRDIGPESLRMLLFQPVIVNKVYFDGWYSLGLITFLYLAQDFKKHALLIVPSAMYFLFLISSLTREGQSGWYMIPLFPFMATALSVFVFESLKKRSFAFFLAPLFVGFFQIEYFIEPILGLSPFMYRVLIVLLFVPLLFAFFLKREFLYEKLGYCYFFLLVFGTILMTHRYIHPS